MANFGKQKVRCHFETRTQKKLPGSIKKLLEFGIVFIVYFMFILIIFN